MRGKTARWDVFLDEENEFSASDDAALVREFKQTGSTDSFESLFRRYGKRLYCVAWKIYRNAELAEDCVQETFRRAMQAIDSFGEAVGEHNFWAWLVTIAKGVCLSDLRRRQTQKKYAEHLALTGNQRQPISPEQRLMIMELISVLRSLPEQYRICYLLLLVEGCTYQEIASITGYRPEQVKTYVQTARRRIERQFSVARRAS